MGRLIAAPGPHAVHLCIDMQNLFAPGAPWATPWLERVLPRIESMVARAPAQTIFTRFIPPRTRDEAHGMWKVYYQKWECITRDRVESRLLRLVPELETYAPPAVVIDRMSYSAFAGSDLHSHLRRKHIDTLIVSGGETDVCVLATVLTAIDLGYRLIIVEDALCSSSDESHDALLGLYGKRFDIQIEVGRSDQINDLWRPAE
jgi:nicotinamidase-related amidase